MGKALHFFWGVVLLLQAGCENETPDTVAEIECALASESSIALEGTLTFSSGQLHLQKVEIAGTKNGEAAFASSIFQPPEQFYFLGDDSNQPIRVPIAEAVYSDPFVDLYFFRDPYVLQFKEETDSPPGDGDSGDDNDGDDNDDDDNDDDGDDDDGDDSDGRVFNKEKSLDLNHFFAHARPSMVLIGEYAPNARENMRVLIALDLDKISLKPPDKSSLIVTRLHQHFATAIFNPDYWFDSIAHQELQNASLVSYKGEPVLFIHKDFNAALHQKIAARIGEGTKLKFDIVNGGS